jgi:hypothetical protein
VETIATAALIGLGVVVTLHAFNGGAPVVKTYLNYVFTGRGAHVGGAGLAHSSGTSTGGSLIRV